MSNPLQGHLAMLCFSMLVSGSFSLGAIIANDIDPVALNAVRFWIAAVVIGAAALATSGLPRSAWRAPWRYLVLGGLFATYFVLMFEGLKTAAPVSAAAVFTLTPVFSGLFGYLLLRQIMTGRMAIALSIGAAGALWVIFRGQLPALFAFEVGRGEIIYFFGVIAHAIYTPMVRRLNRGEPPVVFTFGMLLAGGILLTIIAWPTLRSVDWSDLGWQVWVIIFYLALFASAATFVLLQFATLQLPSAKVMAYTYLTPTWVIGWEIALGRAVPPLIVLGGIGLTIAALLMLLRDETV